MTINSKGEIDVTNEFYQQLREEVFASAASANADTDTIGTLSNGDSRPLIRFDGKKNLELLIVAGADLDELDPIRSMPNIIENIGELNPDVNINIIPIFDFYSLDDHTNIDVEISDYSTLKSVLSDDAQVFSRDQLEQRIQTRIDDDVESENYINSLYEENAVNEVLLYPPDMITYESEKNLSFGQLNAIVEALYDEIADEFYISFFEEGVLLKRYYKENAILDDTEYSFRPYYGCFDMEELSDELNPMRQLAMDCDSILDLHQYDGNKFLLFSENAPKNLSDKIVENVSKYDIPIRDEEELNDIDYIGKVGTRNGVVELQSEEKMTLDGWVKDYAITTESPKAKADVCSLIASLEYVKFNSSLSESYE